ncbi:RNA ligase family protein [Actinoplanes auranticolor]|uniref:RNA ligase family protein n=1 Tax=Actinoplanes auranticolor TaxID=47988 RepID=UPI001BB40BDE|nr:RNA ligase family protein [Actinoplanes auranticolor]
MDLRRVDLRALNSLTKYPSIPTYHLLDARNGGLQDEAVVFSGPVVGTEKVDGTNARMILTPGGGWLLGSREELLHAKGDLIGNPSQGIVAALKPVVEALAPVAGDEIRVIYVELYGGKVGAAAKQYTTDPTRYGWRCFDVLVLRDPAEQLGWPAERIAAWRDGGGQTFLAEQELAGAARDAGLELTPRLFTVDAAELPTDLDKTSAWLAAQLPESRVRLDAGAPGGAEGIVLRSNDRGVIAKARFQDYARTLKRRR